VSGCDEFNDIRRRNNVHRGRIILDDNYLAILERPHHGAIKGFFNRWTKSPFIRIMLQSISEHVGLRHPDSAEVDEILAKAPASQEDTR
jgi:hypothetical protein